MTAAGQAPGGGQETPAAVYAERGRQRAAQVARLERRHRRLANARLAVFALCGVVAWLAWIQHRVSGWWVLAGAVVFIVLTSRHDSVLRRRARARRAEAFYARGLDRLEHRWMAAGDQGLEFLDEEHPYAGDLDLFGRGSLFQLLCTARTRTGKAALAAWLKAPAAAAEIPRRQAAVAELSPRLDLRERLALLGDEVAAGVEPQVLERWSASPPVLAGGAERWLLAAAVLFTVATLGGYLMGPLGPGLPLLAAAIQVTLTGRLRRRVHRVLEAVEEPGRELFLLSEVLELLAAQEYSSPLLMERRRILHGGDGPPHRAIAQLARCVERLDWRGNKFFAPLAMVLAWTSHHAYLLEDWRRRHGSQVPQWLAAVGEMEALGALAGHAWENPDHVFPTLEQDGGPLLEGDGLGHPLLPAAQCVRNDLALGAPLRLLMVSGSNMSGKSTLLRTVGVNAVLALAGAPVRARRLRLTHLALGAAIRINDSLQDGRSRFYAEIVRLRRIMELAGSGRPLLFLLDEILHGTNSHDRRIGAEAVVRGLLARGAMGLVTTHDLALSRVAESLAPAAANIHFQDHLEEGRMIFDYRIHQGVVRRSNALDLMRSVGLEV